jgi:alkanesulfonate monooxygenase SsuD/methylene tetrahydromethanopterin reductase-like flavin-dependent oxidoreductase (luciferase family)
MSEQVAVLRRLWTETTVTHEGSFEKITGAGIAPPPVQRPIPVWFGGSSAPAYRRMGRLADGWFPQVLPGPRLDEAKAIVDGAARAAGRDPDTIGMEGRVNYSAGLEKIVDHVDRWQRAGASHISVNTMGAGLGSVSDHLNALAEVAQSVNLRQ